MPRWLRSILSALALAALALVPAGPARAQDYFGQNKVRYQNFKFKVLKTEHFDIYYYDEEERTVTEAGRMAERWYARLSKSLQHDLSRRQPLILYASHPGFEQTNAVYGDLGEGTGGITESFKRRIILPFAGPISETDHVIGHELVHAFQYDILGAGRNTSLGGSAADHMPLWFMEGMAEYLSLGPRDPHTAMWMRDAARPKKFPDYGRLEDPRFFPYRFGQSLWAYIAGRYGEDAVGRVLKAAARSGDARQAVLTTLGTPPDSLVRDWGKAVRDWAGPVSAGTRPASDQARAVIVAKRDVGRMNLAPALSPDGSRMMFFSERSLLAIDMYLADVRTGKVLRPITRTAVDQHFQSLEFIGSAGEWSPDGKRFALGAVTRARPVLSIIRAEDGHLLKEYRFTDLGEIFNPTWSPDGERIVFSALSDGVTDLWMLDLRTGERRRLTHDPWAELHPVWSPDGHSIAFSTDRFDTTSLGARFDLYRLAILDLDSGAIREVRTFDDGKSTNPQWSPDGKSLYFISDHGGISDLYRLELADGSIRQLTGLLTGVSGITKLSPAYSVARQSGQIVFSAYEDGSYDLYELDGRALAGLPPREPLAQDPALLPPVTREQLALADSVRAAIAAADTMRFRSEPYRARLSLDYIAQPSLGVAVGNGGFGVGGGAALYWSDMLGNHELATLLQTASTGGNFLNNTAAAVAYQNLKSRLNWGLQLSQIPYITSGFTTDEGTLNGQAAVRDRTYRFWQINRQLEVDLSYPLSRAQRVEFSTGLRNIAFASQLQTRIYDANTGTLLVDQTTNGPDSIPSLNLATAGAAYIYDNSAFGGTGPIMGRRMRFDLTNVSGTLAFQEVLADVRQYVRLARPLSLAGRVLHYGRYGGGSEDARLSPFFLGYPFLVRGYDDGSFSSAECAASSNGDPNRCPVFDQLLGSRLAVANAEMRLELLGGLGVIQTPGFPPVEAALFYDAGSAWTSTTKAEFLGGTRPTVTSYGGALRMNLLGFAVGEVALVHPDNRPGKGWYWEFSLSPGF